jgi:hypothetical protein
MVSADEFSSRSRKHLYQLLYYADESGIGARSEVRACCLTDAVEVALADPLARTVDIWEDGEFAGRFTREPLGTGHVSVFGGRHFPIHP